MFNQGELGIREFRDYSLYNHRIYYFAFDSDISKVSNQFNWSFIHKPSRWCHCRTYLVSCGRRIAHCAPRSFVQLDYSFLRDRGANIFLKSLMNLGGGCLLKWLSMRVYRGAFIEIFDLHFLGLFIFFGRCWVIMIRPTLFQISLFA